LHQFYLCYLNKFEYVLPISLWRIVRFLVLNFADSPLLTTCISLQYRKCDCSFIFHIDVVSMVDWVHKKHN